MDKATQIRFRKRALLLVLVVGWSLGVAIGLKSLWGYGAAPGTAGSVPTNWPDSVLPVEDQGRWQLVMFAHPKCPCTKASVEELSRLVALAPASLQTRVAFFTPSAKGPDWYRTQLWSSVEAIPGAEPLTDIDLRLADRFGAQTSGFVVLYDPRGALRFQGGITASRGHAGDNYGSKAIRDALAARPFSATSAPVYGCPLRDETCASEGPCSDR